jgi:acetyltransferase-like isoleucine patch superfamily enzyme
MTMNINYLFQQTFFIIRFRYFKKWINYLGTVFLRSAGMKIGKGTFLSNCQVTWPHQVSIGENCALEHNIYFKFDGIWSKGPSIIIGNKVFIGSGCEFNIRKKISIGNNCLIASGCHFVDHNHNTYRHDSPLSSSPDIEKEIILKESVWIGANVIVLMGVEIGNHAIVGAGSVVIKSIPNNEIWAGVPAKKIGERQN